MMGLAGSCVAVSWPTSHRSHCVERSRCCLRGTFPRRDTTRSSFTSDGAVTAARESPYRSTAFCRGWKNKTTRLDGDLVKLYANIFTVHPRELSREIDRLELRAHGAHSAAFNPT